MEDARALRIQELKERRKRVRMLHIILTLFVIFVSIFIITRIAALLIKSATVTLSVKNIEILQGEELPQLQPVVKLEGDSDAVLDKETGYTAEDFVRDLENGTWYSLKTKADAKVEGTYKVKASMSEEFTENLEKKWKHITFTAKSGHINVKNPVGKWDGDKFKKYDGSYVTNDFVESMAKKYYMDENGVKVTGWKIIDNNRYYFNKDGIMQTGKWKKHKEDKYYLGKNGAAVTGWHDIKKKTYYFDSEGKMATGTQYVGLSLCTFNKKGELVSKKEGEIDPNKPAIALTFDDGPGERTHELLEQLEKYSAHATFFMQGKNVPSYKEEVKKMKEIGCELGNHSYNHPQLPKLSASAIREQMSKTNSRIKAAAGQTATVMRPPYGAINDTVKENVGLPMILWNIDTLDWKTRNAQKTIDVVMDNVGDGDIILMHDIHTQSVDAALKLIPMLQKEGYQLVTVSELAKAKGVKMKNGGRYADFTSK